MSMHRAGFPPQGSDLATVAVRILKAGMLTTVQDSGRWGYQNLGVPVAGPMDRVSHRLANALVGNPQEAATLEVTLMGPVIEFTDDALFAVTGAQFDLVLDGRPLPMSTASHASSGARLAFGACRRGARAYVAFRGGLDLPVVLGSRATHLPSRMGGIQGRAAAAGDEIRIAPATGLAPVPCAAGSGVVRLPAGGARVRVMPGPDEQFFADDALPTLLKERYVVTPKSDRMGYRLAGPPLRHRMVSEMISDATPSGSLQVPLSGLPILLMADCQTTGGYPRIATVITADLPVAGQLAPGDWLEFEAVDRREALAALIAQEGLLQA